MKRVILLLASLQSPGFAVAAPTSTQRILADAILCKANPETAVHELVAKGSDFDAGYAAYGFGEGLSHKAVVILKTPLRIGDASAEAVVTEPESTQFEFSAFTYARFKGDYRAVVEALQLQTEESDAPYSLGHYVSRQLRPDTCPPTIVLTPLDDGEFLLGCGWCNGG